MPHHRHIIAACLLALIAVGLLTGCESSSVWLEKLESTDVLPLWQKVTAIAVSTLISEDLACIAAGMLTSRGAISLGWAIGASFLGIFLGDVLLFVMGRLGGLALLRRIPFRWFLKEHQIIQAEILFQQNGAKLIFSSRLLPGSRLPIYAAAGVLNYPFWKFALFMAIAGLLSSVILVLLSWKMGEVVFKWLQLYESYAIPVFATVLVVAWCTVKLFEILATRRSRLIFLARSRRSYNQFRSFFSKS
tara:strand:- start:5241 stop:5981 length:741 start_codon:yes stop_codon:yes gene_type:complete